jgi:hypothetical protein
MIAEKIKQIRTQKGFSQEELAQPDELPFQGFGKFLASPLSCHTVMFLDEYLKPNIKPYVFGSFNKEARVFKRSMAANDYFCHEHHIFEPKSVGRWV